MKYFMTAFSCKTKTPFVYIKISKSVKLELSVNYCESLVSFRRFVGDLCDFALVSCGWFSANLSSSAGVGSS